MPRQITLIKYGSEYDNSIHIVRKDLSLGYYYLNSIDKIYKYSISTPVGTGSCFHEVKIEDI